MPVAVSTPFVTTSVAHWNTASLKASKPHDVRRIVDLFRKPRTPDQVQLISAHRGLRWGGIAENGKESIRRAALASIPSVEIDIRCTSDGVVVCLHDDGIGRVTNIAEHLGRDDVYDPLTAEGYNPLASSVPWNGVMERLRLKNERGELTDERVLRLADLLDLIKVEKLTMVVFMDIKQKQAMAAAYDAIKSRSDAMGVPALEWCIWKADTVFHRLPTDLEREEWFQDGVSQGLPPLYIPVIDAPTSLEDQQLPLVSAKQWASRSYVVSLEMGLRSPHGPLADVVHWAREAGHSMGFFAALGDVPNDPTPVEDRMVFHEGHPPMKYDELLRPGTSNDGHDHRGDLALFKRLGFSWVIADPALGTEDMFRGQREAVTGK
ncbi:hypothetical protein EHS25_007048 [Saitozyma podzolica]|uniref:GP-PDE domain-containing protein n=1 Tax=Saitozyma podzolica TaxID=1890683 RepID=A0A427XPG0_9TREE|nr:hypothetical protein EHS25_007048 [Saitozyma podzolica]